jgi:hypothetical protein
MEMPPLIRAQRDADPDMGQENAPIMAFLGKRTDG